MGELSRGRLVGATVGVMLALLLAALDQTIVGTAMPRIVAELKGLDYYTWVITAYLVSSTTVIPIAGKLGDLFGRKPFLLAGMVGFVGASALCGLSQNMFELVLFRSVQGLFGGLLFASVFSVLADIFPPRQRARMQGLFGAVFGLSSIVGPTLGGYLTDNLGWRWVFYVNLPVGIAAVSVVATTLPFIRSRASWRDIDFLGAAALAAGLIPLLVALSITRDHAWTSPQVLGLLGITAAMLAAFVVIERRSAEPIVPLHLFRNPTFAVSMLVGFLTALGMFGVIVFVPLDFQGVLGVSVTNSGLLLTPMMLGLIVASIVAGQLMTRLRRYRFIGSAGILLMMAGMLLLSGVTPASRQIEVTRDIVIIGFGLGLTFPLYINAVQSALPQRYLGVASSQIQFWRNVGGTVGTAVLGSILARRLPDEIGAQVRSLDLPPTFRLPNGSGSSPQALFDPAHLAALRAGLPAQAVPLFDRVIEATRTALANTLHDLFLYAVLILGLALVASFFLREVPLRGRSQQPTAESALEQPSPVPAPAP